MADTQALYRECLRLILRPVAAFCVKRSLGVRDILEELKVVLLETAQEHLSRSEPELNVSKLAAMTGVHRRDVRRICKDDQARSEPMSPISRIIGRWQTDPQFARRDGKPRVLNISKENNEFAELVSKVCSDLHPTTALSELERLGIVEHVPRGIRLQNRIYVSRGDLRESYGFMAEDVRDLMMAVENNLTGKEAIKNLHLSTIFDHVASAALPEIREWLLKEGTALHHRTRAFLAQFDCDSKPDLAQARGLSRVMLGTFSLTEEIKESKHVKKK